MVSAKIRKSGRIRWRLSACFCDRHKWYDEDPQASAFDRFNHLITLQLYAQLLFLIFRPSSMRIFCSFQFQKLNIVAAKYRAFFSTQHASRSSVAPSPSHLSNTESTILSC